MRKKIVAGNWKMNMNLEEGINYAKSIKEYFAVNPPVVGEVILCTPFIHLSAASSALRGSVVKLGAQNSASEESGAYTGEVSPSMVRSTGAEYVIIGHSERRTYYNESDSLLNRKCALALRNGLKVIFCCGEVKDERVAGKHFEVVKKQLNDGIFLFSPEELKNIVIAYEPVWAIGTGLTATPEQAQEMHSFIRELIAGKFGKTAADEITILYGGSCKPSNAREIFSKPDVDGGLIGGASLVKEDFVAIVGSL